MTTAVGGKKGRADDGLQWTHVVAIWMDHGRRVKAVLCT